MAGFHALIGIIRDKLKLPRHDPAAEQARREKAAELMQRSEGADLSKAIKEYDRIVGGRPEARKQLEQTNPALVAARDKAITDLRREKVNQELAKKQALQQGRAARR